MSAAGSGLRAGTAADAGLDPERLEAGYRLLEGWAGGGSVPGSAIAVARSGVQVPTRAFGTRMRSGRLRPMEPDAVFLVASVTKPVTATAAMGLVESGQLSLGAPVRETFPELAGAGKDQIRLVHLLTHTSGLPDMLPENLALRQRHAPLSDFVAATCRCSMLFPPGRHVRYQSMGTLLVGEMVERVAGKPLRQVMEQAIFGPLGMGSSSLGIRPDLEERSAEVCLPAEQLGTDWHWNSDYWRRLGAPWGGLFATADDLVRLLVSFLNQGRWNATTRLLGAPTARSMLADQTAALAELPEAERRAQRWGLGWRLGAWGELASARSFCHGGATGTLVGADPDSGLACAIFTTRPGAPLDRVATAVQSAVLD